MNIIGYKIVNSSNKESSGRVDSYWNWRNGEMIYNVSFAHNGKIFPTIAAIKKHLTNVLVKKVSMTDWKLIEVHEKDGPDLASLIDERMMMKVLKS